MLGQHGVDCCRRQRHRQNGWLPDGQVHRCERRAISEQNQAGAKDELVGRIDGAGDRRQRHTTAQTGLAQADAEGLAYGFLRRPQVEKGNQFVGLLSHPVQLGSVEPASGQAAHLARVHVLDVYADRAGRSCRDGYQVAAVTDAHGQAVDVRATGRLVPEHGGAAGQVGGEVEQEAVRRGSRLGTGRRHPDMYRITHGKKVTR